MNDKYDKILGMLYGCAIGDSFAMPSEMWPPERIKETFGVITDFLPSPESNEISGGFKAGETTDDTIVAFIASEEIIRTKGKISPLDVVNGIERWCLENPKSKTIIGPSTKKAFEAIHRGLDVVEAGKNGVTDGAGTRVAPIGVILSSRNPERIAAMSQQVCMATHNTSVGISGASAMAAAVAHGIENRSWDDFVEVVYNAALSGSKLGYERVETDLPERIRKSIERSEAISDDDDFMEAQYRENGSGLPMIEAAPTAIAIAYRCKDDIMRAAKIAANMGGDTDTVAAMACMIIGAHIGASKIDRRVINLISSVNDHPFESVAIKLSGIEV